MEEMGKLRELNLGYQLRLSKLEEDYKNLEGLFAEKVKEEQVRSETYAKLRDSLDKLSTHFLEQRSRNIVLQRDLFESKKELFSVKVQLEETVQSKKELEKKLEFIMEINKKGEESFSQSLEPSKELSFSQTSLNQASGVVKLKPSRQLEK